LRVLPVQAGSLRSNTFGGLSSRGLRVLPMQAGSLRSNTFGGLESPPAA
jgi:hypothetical protein